MRRREFIALVGGAATWSFAARAQQPSKQRLIGVLVNGSSADPAWQRRAAAFRQGLEEIGWTEGRNIHVEWRYSEGSFQRLLPLAREIVGLNPDVIFVNTTPATKAVQRQTSAIPVVFAQVSDPVGAGVVANLARPGGNLTGFLFLEDSIAGKWLGMLKEIAPRLQRAALVANPKGFTFGYFLNAAKTIAPSLALEIVPAPAESAAEIEQSIEAFARTPNGGLFFPPDGLTEANRDLIIALVARVRLPAVYAYREFVPAGGLMFYGPDLAAEYRQAASYVDRVLRGASPSDLPVQAPTKYQTVVNLKTAKAIGFDVPSTLLVRADEVIE